MVMDRRITDEISEEAPWSMMFADDIVICSESKEHVEEKLGLRHSENTRRRGGESGAFHYLKYLGSTVQSNGE